MILITWNVRGLNNPTKQREVRSLIKRHSVVLACLIETRVKEDKAVHIKNNIAPGWGFLNNYEKHYLGKLWSCCDEAVLTLKVIDKCKQAIYCEIRVVNEQLCWFHSFIYGPTNGVERKILW